MVFGVFLTQKKAPIQCLFSTTFGELFLVYSLGKYTRFGYSPPVSVGVGSEIGQICGVFSSKDSKNAHFLTFFERLHPPNNFKNKKQALGALPQTPLTCEAAGAGGKPIHLPLR